MAAAYPRPPPHYHRAVPAQPRRPTIVDVAHRAGVSRQTVSNVVNGRHGLMAAGTRTRVEQAMSDLGYHRHAAARSLRSARTRTLALLLVDAGRGFLADPMTSMLLSGVGDVLVDRGYGLLIQSGRPGAAAQELLLPLLEARADGALLLLSGAPADRRACMDAVGAAGLPAMALGDTLERAPLPVASTADRDGGRAVTGLLLARGHARVGFVAARVPWPMIEERLQGYREAHAERGREPAPELLAFHGDWDAPSGATLAARLLDLPEPPTAIVAGNDLLAAGVLREAARRGLRVPGDLAVTGYDDFAFAEFLEPPLTTVRVPGYELGRQAAERLIARVEDGTPLRSLVLPVEVVERASA
jgi:DNA-binding LacI/PurR family transcriptional regulator